MGVEISVNIFITWPMKFTLNTTVSPETQQGRSTSLDIKATLMYKGKRNSALILSVRIAALFPIFLINGPKHFTSRCTR